MTDITLQDEGTVVGLTMVTPAAQTWADEKLITEGWQWMGPTLWVDHRVAPDLVQLAVGDGLLVSDCS